MQKIVRRTRRFDMDNTEDLREYDEIVNDPNCTILREMKEKLQDKEFDDGKLSSLHERVVLVITYEIKELL